MTVTTDLVERIWARDPTVWTGGDEAQWLGWLDEPQRMQEQLDDVDPEGEPRYAPASYHIDALAATRVPSRLAPSFILTFVPDVGPVARNTSSRVITIFTG